MSDFPKCERCKNEYSNWASLSGLLLCVCWDCEFVVVYPTVRLENARNDVLQISGRKKWMPKRLGRVPKWPT